MFRPQSMTLLGSLDSRQINLAGVWDLGSRVDEEVGQPGENPGLDTPQDDDQADNENPGQTLYLNGDSPP